MTRFDLAAQEHPSYIFASDVQLPAGFTDISDLNRYGPEFRHVSGMCAVWFNYPSDNPHASRYVVSTTLDQRGIDSGDARHYWYKCTTWAEVLGHVNTWRKRTGNEGARHTPGPWGYSGPSDIGRDTYSIYANGPLAYTAGPSDYGDSAEANAYLIASAPELLEALEALVQIIEEDHYKCDINSDEDCDLLKSEREIRHQHGRLREAKQAIAKAKGGA